MATSLLRAEQISPSTGAAIEPRAVDGGPSSFPYRQYDADAWNESANQRNFSVPAATAINRCWSSATPSDLPALWASVSRIGRNFWFINASLQYLHLAADSVEQINGCDNDVCIGKAGFSFLF